ncbi:MAG: HD domain-containing phosphohydrolase, partial [Burkholderiales bacterium]
PSDERALAEGMCRAIVDAGGYQMAWVGFAEDNPDKTVRPVAIAGGTEEYFKTLQVTWADNEHGQGPTGRAIREGVPIVVHDTQLSSGAERWREHVGRFGYASIIALPLKVDDGNLGALVIGAAETTAFAEQEAVLLGEVASDLSFAILAQRSRAEHERLKTSLRTVEERFGAAAEASPDALFVFKSVRDSAGNIVDFEITAMNARAAQQIGMARDEAIGKTYLGLLPRYQTSSLFEEYAQVASTGNRFEGEFSFDVPQKGLRWFRQQVVQVGDGIAVSLRDITGWKNAGDKLRQSEERLRRAMKAAHMGAWQWDLARDQLSSSGGLGALFGMAPEWGPRNSTEFLKAVHPADREALARAMARDHTTDTPGQFEYRVLWPDDSTHWLAANTNVILDAYGKPAQVVGLVTDITERKEAEIARDRATRALKTLSAGNEELVRSTNESDLLHAVCRVIVAKGGYAMAFVGYPTDDPEKAIVPMAWAGIEDGYVTAVRHTWADTAEGQRPISRAIRTKKRAICRNILSDPAFGPVREIVAKHGYASNIALPLLDGTRIIGTLSIHSKEQDSFDEAEIRLLEELAGDLSYGIVTLRTRAERDKIAHEHEHHAEILRRGLEESIQAIAATVEMRDPYTSGHQKRVADIATAIARAMGLDDERIRSIHLAGVVHDLGKIRVPAEILAKPGKLSATEYELIKVHPQVGYDILKDISFPWPLARIVLEHHERVDGSGYPRGIKGDEMLLESRIMAVADVVEAMASHRPYRASLGMEPALKEIEHGRGTAYDSAVVDAFLKLVREDGFGLPT